MAEYDLFIDEPITIEELFEAYYDCRKNKRTTASALSFELDLEHNLAVLLSDINNFTYQPQPYNCFIINNPTVREVFAASFRDRIVHHLVINAVNPILEKRLIRDAYACRVGKGSHMAIERLRHFMASSTNNWKDEAWCLKLDIASFFASIDRDLLFSRLSDYLERNYMKDNYRVIMYLIEKILLTEPTENVRFVSPRNMWSRLPLSKSLFNAPKGKGLPIGNLTSQVFANFYMAPLDHYIKHDLGIKMYGRYVDDFFLIHKDKEYLKMCLEKIREFLSSELKLSLSAGKVVLQRVNHGIEFLGVRIEEGHINMKRRTEHNFRSVIKRYNEMSHSHKLYFKERKKLLSSVNSYLGIMRHYNTFKRRVELMSLLEPRILSLFRMHTGYRKITLKR